MSARPHVGQSASTEDDRERRVNDFVKEHGIQPFQLKEALKFPGFNRSGREVLLMLNTYKVLQYPNKIVYQYDVSDPIFEEMTPDKNM